MIYIIVNALEDVKENICVLLKMGTTSGETSNKFTTGPII